MAERNKSYALFSIALLDKVYAQEIKKLNNTTVPLTDLPSAINVVNQLKDNPNPMVRESAIEALIYENPDVFYLDVTKMYINIITSIHAYVKGYNDFFVNFFVIIDILRLKW